MHSRGAAAERPTSAAGSACALAASLAAVVLAFASPATAQQPPGVVKQLQRTAPEYDPLGVRLGGFLAFPRAGLDVAYDDNVFADRNGEVEDFVAIASPGLRLVTTAPVHALEIDIGADIGRYAEETSENFEDAHLAVTSRLDIRRDRALHSSAAFERLHVERGSPDEVNGVEPTLYDRSTLGLGYGQSFNRLSFRADVGLRAYDFDDVGAANGREINNDDRDRSEYRLAGRLQYAFAPLYSAFSTLRFDRVEYEQTADDNGLRRDSRGPEAELGLVFAPEAIVTGEFAIGYAERDFEDSRLEDVDLLTARGELAWRVTSLSTLWLEGRRELQETTIGGASGAVATFARIGAEHELRRNVTLSAAAQAGWQDFSGVDRDDDILSFRIGGKYLLNRNAWTGLEYEFFSRDSSVRNVDFDRNTILLRLMLQL